MVLLQPCFTLCSFLTLIVRRIRMARRGIRTTLLKAIIELFHQHSSIRWATSEWASASSSITKTLMKRQVRAFSPIVHHKILLIIRALRACVLSNASQQGWMYATARTETPESCWSASRAWASTSSSTMTRHAKRWSVFSERVSSVVLWHSAFMPKPLFTLSTFCQAELST